MTAQINTNTNTTTTTNNNENSENNDNKSEPITYVLEYWMRLYQIIKQ